MKKINYGLSILKSILSFDVIRSHCYNVKSSNNLLLFYVLGKKRSIHVPSFFILSFYFNFNCLITKNSTRNTKRFERLLIPYISWPLIVYCINKIIGHYFNIGLALSFKKLIIQLIIGRGIIDTFWFQFDLILTTFLFIFVIYITKTFYLLYFQIIMLVSYLLQYSKYNDYFFSNFKLDIQISLGREIMMLPFAVTGFTFASFNALNKINEYKYSTFILCIIIFLFVDYFNIFFPMDPFNGIKPNIQSICLIFIFSNLSFDKIKNKYIKTIIEYITRYIY